MARLLTILVVAVTLGTSASDRPPPVSPHRGGAVVSPRPTPAGLAHRFASLPLRFEANQGQTDARVKFLARGPGYTVFLTGGETVLRLSRPQPSPPAVIRMEFRGGDPGAASEGVGELPGKSHYFTGRDPSGWRTNVPAYAQTRFRDVYPGIDVVYYGRDGGTLEYDFVVAPGADSRAIALAFAGVESVDVDAAGDLRLATGDATVTMRRPVVYQQIDGARREIGAAYAKTGAREVRIALAAYDTTRPLIIDPAFSYSTFLGGLGTDQAFGIAVDGAGNAFIAGSTTSADFPDTLGAFQRSLVDAAGSGVSDAFVAKINAGGTALEYATYLGGTGTDEALRVAINALGEAHVVGLTASADFPTTAGVAQRVIGGGTDAFVTRLNATGSALVFSTFLGGSDEDVALGVALDGLGAVYVTGRTASVDFPTGTPLQATLAGSRDAFVTKLTALGVGVYSTYLGGAATDSGSGIAVSAAGEAYVAGVTTSADFPTTAGVVQGVFGGGEDAFVVRLNAAGGALIYGTYLGGTGTDGATSLAIDGSGNAYVTGTATADFPTTAGAFQTVNAGGSDAFVTKLSPTATTRVYSTFIGGTGRDEGQDIVVDAALVAHVVGNTATSHTAAIPFPIAGTVPQSTFGGGSFDAFVTLLNGSGTALVYSTYVGGSGRDVGVGIALDASGNDFVTGSTASADFPTFRALQAASAGGTDAFVVKIEPGGIPGPGGGSTGSNGGGDDDQCFIATAAFGSPLAREVQVLREFRDRWLLTSAVGRVVVKTYYRVSPPVAAAIERDEVARMAARAMLVPVIWSVRMALDSPGPLLVSAGALGAAPLLVVALAIGRRCRKRAA